MQDAIIQIDRFSNILHANKLLGSMLITIRKRDKESPGIIYHARRPAKYNGGQNVHSLLVQWANCNERHGDVDITLRISQLYTPKSGLSTTKRYRTAKSS